MQLKKRHASASTAIGSAIVMVLILSGTAFAYATRTQQANSTHSPVAPSEDSHTNTNSTAVSETEQHQKNGDNGQCGEHEGESNSTATTTTTSVTTTCTGNEQTEANQTTGAEEQCGENEHTSSTASSTASTTSCTGNEQEQQELKFRLVNASSSAKGQGEVNIHIDGTTLRVDVEISRALPSTSYDVVLVATSVSSTSTTVSSSSSTTTTSSSTSGGCSGSIGTLVTSDEGEGHAHLETSLPAGNYQIGLILCEKGAVSLVSSPATEPAVVGLVTTHTESDNGERAKVVSGNEKDESEIDNATKNDMIPAVVQFSNSGASIVQLDPKFSVSVGKSDNGLVISISGNNVTGSRVLLVNITKDSLPAIQSGELLVTFDGTAIPEATSLSQVLSQTGTSPSYIVIGTASGYQLLVYIPHFSVHVIQLIAAPLGALGPGLSAQIPLAVAGIAVFTAAAAILYAKRRSYTSV